MEGVCKLCLQKKDIVDSHIFPKALTKELASGEGYFYQVGVSKKTISRKTQRLYSERLLCKHCDGVIIKRYEDELFRLIRSSNTWTHPAGTNEFFIRDDINTLLLRKAILSLIWRSSISQQSPPFQNINLGEKHSETIRKILISENDFPKDQYPSILSISNKNDYDLGNILYYPTSSHFEKGRLYKFIIFRHFFYVYISSHNPSFDITAACIQSPHILAYTTNPFKNTGFLKSIQQVQRGIKTNPHPSMNSQKKRN